MDGSFYDAAVIWRVRLLDGPVLEDLPGSRVHRFRSRRVGALLAYLALHAGKPCSREEIYEAIWPDEDTTLVANRFRVALASLRKQMELPGMPYGSVLDTSEPGLVRMRAVWCDTDSIDQAVRAGRKREALSLCNGTFLPGYYYEWVVEQRERLEAIRTELEETAPETDEAHIESSQAKAAETFLPPTGYSPLPHYLTQFFGREDESRQLLNLIEEYRLVTITGPGGIGKTRLAATAVQTVAPRCVFVSLAELSDSAAIVDSLLKAFGVSNRDGQSSVAQIITVLGRRDPVVLIMDNAEHVVDNAADIVLALLSGVPTIKIVVTSRQLLEIPGEATLGLGPLQTPPAATVHENLAEFPSAALFIDRARRARPDFVLSTKYTDAVIQICRQLEGMPLALELAASRIWAQTPMQIAQDLAAGLTGLKSRQRGLAERHRSLRSVVDGSVRLLNEPLRDFFCDLSIFHGGWTTEAAAAVTGKRNAIDMLDDLTARSLVTAGEDSQRGSMRYSLLETMRQFAAEELSDDRRNHLEARHTAYYLTLSTRIDEDDLRTLVPLDVETENVKSAIERGWERNDEEFWHGLSGALVHAFVRGHHRTALGWTASGLAIVDTLQDPELRCRFRNAACPLLLDVGRLDEAQRVADDLKADAQSNGRSADALMGELYTAYICDSQGGIQTAVNQHRDILKRARRLENPILLRRSLSLTSRSLVGYATVVLTLDSIESVEALSEAEALMRELIPMLSPYSRYIPMVELFLAAALFGQRSNWDALIYLKSSQRKALVYGTKAVLMHGFYQEARLSARIGNWKEAAKRFGAFLNLKESMNYSVTAVHNEVTALESQIREELGSERFDLLIREGRNTPHEILVPERELPLRPGLPTPCPTFQQLFPS